MKDLEKLTVEELVRLISPNSDVHKELRRREVIRTKNITGELGEYYVVQYYNNTPGQSNLFLPPPGVKNIDVMNIITPTINVLVAPAPTKAKTTSNVDIGAANIS